MFNYLVTQMKYTSNRGVHLCLGYVRAPNVNFYNIVESNVIIPPKKTIT